MATMRIGLLATIGLAACMTTAAAQSSTTEDRLREALRQTVIDMRAAQDSQATLQASLDQMKTQRDALQQQVDRLTAQAAEHPAAPAQAQAQAGAPAPAPAPPPVDEAKYRAAIDALRQQNAQLQAGLQKWQAAYQNAAGIAQTKDLDSRQSQATLGRAQTTLSICEDKNKRLLAVANDILHLYQTQSFRSLLVGSYEPILGFKKVELENIMQDNEDRIRAQQYYPGEQPHPAPAAATKASGR
jgi:DNA repair exonuclease SbcCD ATPase subunit